MPNICDFRMKAVGNRESLKMLEKILIEDYDYLDEEYINNKNNIKHLSRVFSAHVEESYFNNNDDGFICVCGECAWSVDTCMLSGDGTYYNMNKNTQSNVTCLEEITKELGLVIEIFSEEYGMEFTEHILVNNGNVLINDVQQMTTACACEGKEKLSGKELDMFMEQYAPCPIMEKHKDIKSSDCQYEGSSYCHYITIFNTENYNEFSI